VADTLARRERELIWVEDENGGFWFAVNAPRHGSRSIYNGWLCRCPPCRDANTAYFARYSGRATAAA
jgi:hypothetical protein